MALVTGTPGNDTALVGTNDADVIIGLQGNDNIAGLGGDDIIEYQINHVGTDTVDGGLGDDTLLFHGLLTAGNGAGFHVTNANNRVTQGDNETVVNSATNVEKMVFDNLTIDLTQNGTTFATFNTGNKFTRTFSDGVDADNLDDGGLILDITGTTNGVWATVGANKTIASVGEDNFDTSNNRITSVNGINVVGGGADTIPVGDGGSYLVVNTNRDEVRYFVGRDVVAGKAAGTEISEGSVNLVIGGRTYTIHLTAKSDGSVPSDQTDGDDTYTGTAGDDLVDLGKGNDLAVGGDGNDTINGGDGNDTVWAGADDTGNDVLNGGRGNDILAGGAGNDTINGGDDNDTIYGGAGNDSLSGNDDDDVIWGGAGKDTINGGEGDDILGGGEGDDTINGNDGDDIIYGGKDAGKDLIDGGAGNDVIYGGAGNDTLNGGSGDDLIFNGAGDDVVNGGTGEDTLWGGEGNDILTGGANDDTFAFTANNGLDTITDFSLDNDKIDLTEFGFSYNDVLARMTQSGGNVVINLGDGTIVTVNGHTIAQLDADQFIL